MPLTSCALTAVWLYAARRRLLRPSVGPRHVRMVTVRAAITPAITSLSVPASLLGLPVAVVVWMGLLPLARVLVGRVMTTE